MASKARISITTVPDFVGREGALNRRTSARVPEVPYVFITRTAYSWALSTPGHPKSGSLWASSIELGAGFNSLLMPINQTEKKSAYHRLECL